MSDGIPPKRPEEEDEEFRTVREAGALEELATPGRSARPLGRGCEGMLKLRLGEGDGAERIDGRERVRGADMLGLRGGLLRIGLPRKVEGRVTCEA